MKQIMLILAKLLIWIIVGLFSLMFSLALLIGLAEGDLSQGMGYYL